MKLSKDSEKAPTQMGANRTGVDASPIDKRKVIEGASLLPPSSPGTEASIAAVTVEYAREAGPIGSMPPPSSLRGMGNTALQALRGHSANVLLDKLGERAAFERSGTRLYDALIAKYDAQGGFPGGPTRAELVHLRNEEHEHFILVSQAIEGLGADPTTMTPAADVQAVASLGLFKVLGDPRMTLSQSLEAILIAELADNDAWVSLVQLARHFGQEELAKRFEKAQVEEDEHLVRVRSWIQRAQIERAGGEKKAA